MTRRPVIGITVDHNSRDLGNGKVEHSQYLIPHSYAMAVEKAGGLPIMLPYRSIAPELLQQYAEMCDGFVFSGSSDYDPAAWGEARHEKAVAIDPDREAFERALLKIVDPMNRPVLGICGGCQVMNLHRGGSLHQFIPDMGLAPSIEHRRLNLDEWAKRHEVRVDPESKLGQITGKSLVASNSSHKQSVNKVGSGLKITAKAPDGVVEAIEDPSKPFFVAVQWHPERQHEEADHLKLFEALIKAARATMRK